MCKHTISSTEIFFFFLHALLNDHFIATQFSRNLRKKKCPRPVTDLLERNSGGLGQFQVPEELSETVGSRTQVAPLQIVTNVSVQ